MPTDDTTLLRHLDGLLDAINERTQRFTEFVEACQPVMATASPTMDWDDLGEAFEGILAVQDQTLRDCYSRIRLHSDVVVGLADEHVIGTVHKVLTLMSAEYTDIRDAIIEYQYAQHDLARIFIALKLSALVARAVQNHNRATLIVSYTSAIYAYRDGVRARNTGT